MVTVTNNEVNEFNYPLMTISSRYCNRLHNSPHLNPMKGEIKRDSTAIFWIIYINHQTEMHKVRTLLAKTLLLTCKSLSPKISDKGIGGTLAGTPPVLPYRRHYCFVFQVFHQREDPKDDRADFYTSSDNILHGPAALLRHNSRDTNILACGSHLKPTFYSYVKAR